MMWNVGRAADLEPRCAQDGCSTGIILQRAQQCGANTVPGKYGCGKYFCDDHLLVDPHPHAITPYLCPACFQHAESHTPRPADRTAQGVGRNGRATRPACGTRSHLEATAHMVAT